MNFGFSSIYMEVDTEKVENNYSVCHTWYKQ